VDFLELMGVLLDTPIEYSPMLVGDIRVYVTGRVEVAKKDLRGFMEMILESKCFLLVEAPYGDRIVLRVMSTRSHHSRPWMAYAINLAPGEIESWKNRRALVTTSVLLHNIDSRSALASFSPFIDTNTGSVRNVENSNALIITARANAVYKLLDLVRAVDIPSEREGASGTLMRRMSEIEGRLAELEDS
jgi:type II secretory pathway component GspD/PulD (secretin)